MLPAKKYRSAAHFTAPPKGVTILEVLFAILIATVGLLGAFAVFPVASSQARKGQIADQVASCADAAVHTFDAAGMRRSDRWLYWYIDPTGTNPSQYLISNTTSLRDPFLIDPAFIADNTDSSNQLQNPNNTRFFPCYSPIVPPTVVMSRLTLTQSALSTSTLIMSRAQADTVMGIEDMLVFDRPKDNSLPAYQQFSTHLDKSGTTIVDKRQDENRLSWTAMVTPKINLQDNSTTGDATVSIMVHFNRLKPLALNIVDITVAPYVNEPDLTTYYREWTAGITSANFQSGGIQGGEVTIAAADRRMLTPIHRDSWVMLSTNINGNGFTIPWHRWYRVLDTGEIDTANNQLALSLYGQDWPLYDSNGDGLGDTPYAAQVTIMPSVIAIFEKTIHLEQN